MVVWCCPQFTDVGKVKGNLSVKHEQRQAMRNGGGSTEMRLYKRHTAIDSSPLDIS